MRLSCKIGLKKDIEIPENFRQGLLSLIKESIRRSSADGELFYKIWYSENKKKPFTFSAFFAVKKDGHKCISQGDYFNFIFSTNDNEFLIRVYNGLLNVSKDGFYLYGQPLHIKSCNLLPEKRFDKNSVIFKTISPFLLRDPNDGDYYLYPVEAEDYMNSKPSKFKYWKGLSMTDFEDMVKKNIERNMGEKIEKLELDVYKVVPVRLTSKSSNFSVTYPGIKAKIKIKAGKNVLKHIYDLGIGARRSEGFGMLEVEDE